MKIRVYQSKTGARYQRDEDTDAEGEDSWYNKETGSPWLGEFNGQGDPCEPFGQSDGWKWLENRTVSDVEMDPKQLLQNAFSSHFGGDWQAQTLHAVCQLLDMINDSLVEEMSLPRGRIGVSAPMQHDNAEYKVLGLCFGFNKYDTWPDLLHCEADAQEVALSIDKMASSCYSIAYLPECHQLQTKHDIEVFFRETVIQQIKRHGRKLHAILTFFAGHGHQHNNDMFLVPPAAAASLDVQEMIKLSDLTNQVTEAVHQAKLDEHQISDTAQKCTCINIFDGCRDTTLLFKPHMTEINSPEIERQYPFCRSVNMYSASRGAAAGDGTPQDGHSPYVQALRTYFFKHNTKLCDVQRALEQDPNMKKLQQQPVAHSLQLSHMDVQVFESCEVLLLCNLTQC